MVTFLIDVVAEFANVRVKGGTYSSKLENLAKSGNKKVFAFTNKDFVNKITNKRSNTDELPKRFFNLDELTRNNKTNLNIYDYAALKNSVSNGWLTSNQIDKKIINKDNLNIKDVKDLERMGIIKTQIALNKLKQQPQPKSNAKILTRTLTVPNEKLNSFLDIYKNNSENYSDDFVKKKKGKLFFKNNISTTADPTLTFGLNRKTPNSKIKFMIKPKKNSRGRYLADNGNIFEEEVMFPKDVAYEIKHVKNNKGFYNIRLDEI